MKYLAQSASSLFVLFFPTAALRADLVMEQQTGGTNQTHVVFKLHGDQMRMDQPDASFSVIVDLNTRDSYTLITTNKTYLNRFGSEVRWQMSEEKKQTGGTNEMDAAPARAVDTGKSEKVNGYDAEIYTWSGAFGLKETLWVARDFPKYNEIKAELVKLDKFNDSGPHRNEQPMLSFLPGMVIKSESVLKGHKVTTTLVSAKVEPVDASLFEVPADYTPWKPPNKIHGTNAPSTP